MKRGHLYRIATRSGAELTVLVISDNVVNDHIKGATVVQLYQPDQAVPSMISAPVRTETVEGTVVCDRYATYAARYFLEDLGAIDQRTMEAVEVCLRTVFRL